MKIVTACQRQPKQLRPLQNFTFFTLLRFPSVPPLRTCQGHGEDPQPTRAFQPRFIAAILPSGMGDTAVQLDAPPAEAPAVQAARKNRFPYHLLVLLALTCFAGFIRFAWIDRP